MTRLVATQFYRLRRRLAWAILICFAASYPASALNLFEWSAVAQVVVCGEVRAIDGRYVELEIDRVLRGPEAFPNVAYVDLKHVNKSRNRTTDARSLKMTEGQRYVLLLEPTPLKMRSAGPAFDLARDVRGAREIPAEGEEAFIDALSSFIEIHQLKSDSQTWERFSAMLQDANPIKQEIALAQFLKFRRGQPEMARFVRPLLGHPRADFREGAARLAGQMLTRWSPEDVTDADALRTELIGRARRDEELAVRIAATQALANYRDDAMKTVLEEIADEDPDQEVRYVAERLLYERRKQSRSPR